MGINLSEWAEGMLEIGEEWLDWVKGHHTFADCPRKAWDPEPCEAEHLSYEDFDEAKTTAGIQALDLCTSAYKANPSY